MIPSPLFPAVSLEVADRETAEFLSEIEERAPLETSALLKEVMG